MPRTIPAIGAMTERAGSRPLLVLVSGTPGSGKSTLARRLADEDALWLPLLSVDAFKRGLAETQGISLALDADARSTITGAAVGAFFAAIGYFLRSGMSVIAEFSFRRDLAEHDLAAFLAIARVVNVHCAIDPVDAQRRFLERERARQYPVKGAGRMSDQMVRGSFDWTVFGPLALGVPMLRVDTTRMYAPNLETIVAFCRDNSVARE